MNHIETQIVKVIIEDILAAGHSISVLGEGELDLAPSTDPAAILDVIGISDETTLLVGNLGGILLVHGNDGDVIADYHVMLAPLLIRAEALAERFQ